MCIRSVPRDARGVTLIELIIFIVVVSIAMAGVLIIFITASKNSSDPAIRKQMLAVAEAMLEEIDLMRMALT